MCEDNQTTGDVMLERWTAGASIATLAHDYHLHVDDMEGCLRRIVAKLVEEKTDDQLH